MSPTSIILCMAACFVGLVAALIVVNRFGSMSTRKLVVIAMMVAVYVVLNTVGTIRLGWINISVSALPNIVGALLYGPGGGLMVGLVGAFLGQLMTYGVTATTVLWIIPPAVRGLLIGLYAKRCGYELSLRLAPQFEALRHTWAGFPSDNKKGRPIRCALLYQIHLISLIALTYR